MNEKIVEKFKDLEFLKKIMVMSDKEQVKEEFKKNEIEVNDKDLEELRDLIKCSVEIASNLSSEELEKVAAGYADSVVHKLRANLFDWAINKLDELSINGKRAGSDYIARKDRTIAYNFYDTIQKHSDKIVEAGLATMLVGMSVGGTLGLQKLIKTGKEKGWWTKDYWIKKK